MPADLKYAYRQLRKSPAFTLTAVITLALGIGANTAIYSLVDSIMLRPLPFPQQDRLAQIGYSESEASFFPKGWIRALGEHSEAFSGVAGFGPDTESNISAGDSSDRVFGAAVTTNTFDLLAIHPALGSFFTADNARAGQEETDVLSNAYWRQRFGGDPNVIGRSLRIDGVWRRVLGVMPADVHFPYADTQFLTPVTFKGGDPVDPWKIFDLRAFGRLKGSVTPAQAQAELRRLHPLLLPLFPWRLPDVWASQMSGVPLLDSQVGATRPRLLLLFAAVALILLIACANVANLMLARAAGREREMAIRGALGATGARLIRQLLSESILLGILSGIVGLMAAAVSLRALVKLLPADTPRVGDISLHWTVFLFAAGISVATGVLFGLIPALKMAKPDLQGTLRSGGRGIAGKASQFRVAMALVVGQIGLSVVVIAAAGLMLHSLCSLSQVDPGFLTDRIVTAEVSLDATACRDKGHCQAFFDTLLDRARGIEGADGVALADTLPLSGRDSNYPYDAEGHPRDARQGALLATARTVSPAYFSTLGMRLVQGRLLTPQDESGASHAVVINQRMADRLWPGQSMLGRHILNVIDEASPAVWNAVAASVVVGVVENTHETSLSGDYGDDVYLPMTAAHEQPVMYVLLRTHTGAAEAASALRRVVAGIDPQVPVTQVRSLNEVVSASESAPRSLAILLLAFGLLAVAIGAVGIYSLIAYIVSWRTREIGIRLAHGAQRWQIVQAIVKQSVLLAAAGSAFGLVAAAATARLLHSFLFGVSEFDPVTFIAVPLLIFALALAAAWIPARYAASVDPMEALRAE